MSVRFQPFKLERSVVSAGEMRWLPVADIYVRLTPMRHRVRVKRGSQIALASHEARMRFHGDVAPGLRLRRKQRIVLIHAVEIMGRRQSWLSCMCEEQQSLGAGRAIEAQSSEALSSDSQSSKESEA